MSWSLSVGPTKKENLSEAIAAAEIPSYVEGPALDQVRAAFDAAELIAKSIPGPYVIVNLSGHANGVGWQQKAGYANDTITVGVTQLVEENLQYYQRG